MMRSKIATLFGFAGLAVAVALLAGCGASPTTTGSKMDGKMGDKMGDKMSTAK
jgi:hypothetical protein